MFSVEQLGEFLCYCLAFNVGMLLLTVVSMLLFKEPIMSIHHKLFGVAKEDLARIYFSYAAIYKILIIAFNLVPWLAVYYMTH